MQEKKEESDEDSKKYLILDLSTPNELKFFQILNECCEIGINVLIKKLPTYTIYTVLDKVNAIEKALGISLIENKGKMANSGHYNKLFRRKFVVDKFFQDDKKKHNFVSLFLI